VGGLEVLGERKLQEDIHWLSTTGSYGKKEVRVVTMIVESISVRGTRPKRAQLGPNPPPARSLTLCRDKQPRKRRTVIDETV
jgi:hypothetical protein